MPIPRIVGQWNKAGLNRVTKHIAPWTPGFGVVIHRGRRLRARISDAGQRVRRAKTAMSSP